MVYRVKRRLRLYKRLGDDPASNGVIEAGELFTLVGQNHDIPGGWNEMIVLTANGKIGVFSVSLVDALRHDGIEPV